MKNDVMTPQHNYIIDFLLFFNFSYNHGVVFICPYPSCIVGHAVNFSSFSAKGLLRPAVFFLN